MSKSESERDRLLMELAARVADGEDVEWDDPRLAAAGLDHTVDAFRAVSELSSHFGAAQEERASAHGPEGRPPTAGQPAFRWGSLEVHEQIGRGGFGIVYRAREPALERDVALKLARPDRAGKVAAARFAEARRLARIRHPNVLTVYGVAEHDGRTGLWSELIDGVTLEQLLADQGPFSADEATRVGLDLCRALAAIHSKNLTHGDIKTSNVMREQGGRIVLMDFGAGDEIGPVQPGRGSDVQGTPLVMAPELLAGGRPNPRTDLYSLGVLLYRLCTQSHPLEAQSLPELLAALERGATRPLLDRRPDLPAGFVRTVERALSTEPAERPASAGEMERELAGRSASPPIDVAAPSPTPRPTTAPDFDQLVGRDVELELLGVELAELSKGRARPVLINGPAGIGKTQLLRHFERKAQAQARFLSGRFYDYPGSRLTPFELPLDLLRVATRSSPSTSTDSTAVKRQPLDPEASRERIRRRCEVELPHELFAKSASPEEAPRPDGSRADRYRAIAPLGECFLALARERPLVLVFDDLQWADEPSLDFLAYLMQVAEGSPLWVILLSRRDEVARNATVSAWLSRQAANRNLSVLRLEPLDRGDLRRTIASVFGENPDSWAIPSSDVRALQRATGGNPYFLTEMLRLLIARGLIRRETNGQWRWMGIGTLELPDSLVLAARARLDALDADLRRFVENAAVVGDEFRIGTVASLMRASVDEIDELAEAAADAGVLTSDRLSAGEDYRFVHSVLRRVLYDGLRPSRRRRLHRRTAEALETIYRDEEGRVAGAVSAHWQEAGEARPTLEWSLRAWRAARARWLWPEAVAALERAMSVAAKLGPDPITDDQRLGMEIGLAEGWFSIGRLQEAEELLETTLARLDADSERALTRQHRAAGLLQLAAIRSARGRYREALEAADAAHSAFAALDDSNGVCSALVQAAATHAALGEYEAVARLAGELDQSNPQPHQSSAMAGTHGWVLALQGRAREGVVLLERSLAHLVRSDDLRQRALLLRRLHWVHLSRGEYSRAIELAEDARDDFRRAEDVVGEGKSIMGIGQSRIGQGVPSEGIQHLERTLEILAERGDSHCEAEVLWLLGRGHHESGRSGKARELVSQGLAMVREIGDRDDEFRMLVDLARIERGLGQPERARDRAVEAGRIAAELGNDEGVGFAEVEEAEALCDLELADEAIAIARSATERLDRASSGDAWRAWHVLGRAAEETGDAQEAMSALRAAVSALDTIRDDLGSSDRARRAEATRVRSAPAARLCSLLRDAGETAEADELASSWELTG